MKKDAHDFSEVSDHADNTHDSRDNNIATGQCFCFAAYQMTTDPKVNCALRYYLKLAYSFYKSALKVSSLHLSFPVYLSGSF